MTRQKMIKTLEKIHDALLWESNDECLQKNEEYKDD